MMITKITSKALISLFSACALLGVFAAPAPAASSSGAEVIKYDACENYYYDTDIYTVCSKVKGEYNLVLTPSGNYKYQVNAKFEYSVALNGVLWFSGQGSDHYSHLFKKDELQEHHFRSSAKYTQPGETCTYSYAYHFANGQVQFDNYDFHCVPA